MINMPKFFQVMDKVKPFYDKAYAVTLFICKVLLCLDILITSYAVLGRYVHQFIPFITDPKWSEEIVLTFMSYCAVLAAALAIRKNTHIRLSAFDRYLPKKVILVLDLLADIAITVFALIMIIVGWDYAFTLGARASYISLPKLPKFWMYFPIPLAGIAMIIFEIEKLYTDIRAFFVKDEPGKEGVAA